MVKFKKLIHKVNVFDRCSAPSCHKKSAYNYKYCYSHVCQGWQCPEIRFKGNYCISCGCKVSDCTNGVPPGEEPYCNTHRCCEGGCNELRTHNLFCERHKKVYNGE